MTAQHLSLYDPSTNPLLERGKAKGSSTRKDELWPNESYTRHLLANIPGLIYQFLLRKDGSLSFLFLSPTFQEFFEVDSPEMEMDTDTLIAMIHPEDRQDFYDSIATAAGMLQSWRWVGRFILPSGLTKWIQWDAQPSLQKNGNIFWNGLLVDVTSQQQLNAEIERLSFLFGLTELLQTSTNLKDISEFALAYLVQSTNCTFGDVKEIVGIDENCQACPLTNYIATELVTTYGKSAIASGSASSESGIVKGEGLLWKVVETGKPVFIKYNASELDDLPEFRHPAVGGMGIFPITATSGTVMGLLTLECHHLEQIQHSVQQELLLAACRILGVRIERAKDRERLQKVNAALELKSRELQHKAEELEETLQELQQTQTQLVHSEKMSSLGQLVAGIAHEINNPVNFIHGNISHAARDFQDMLHLLHLYQRHYPDPVPEIRSAIEEVDLDFVSVDLPKLISSIKIGADRIRDIVYSLRNFSRLDEAERKPVDIHEGIDNTLLILNHRLRTQPNRPEIRLIKEYGNLPFVECYAGQLNQVFMNLIANAIDALEEEHQREKSTTKNEDYPTIRIRTELVDNCHVSVRIRDNGSGIPESVLPRIFDPFFTTKPVGKGTGLGLSISHRIIIEQHKGKLNCISAPGEGTEFAIVLPHTLRERDSVATADVIAKRER
ncbi:MAG TPA: ATP-binding protein [Leptolyngbyaceae cyanobacterium]